MRAFLQLESSLHFVVSWVLLAATTAMWVWAVRHRQRHHLLWIVPWFVNNCVEAVYRTLDMFRLLRPLVRLPVVWLGIQILIDIADVCMALGTLALFYVLKTGRLPEPALVSDPHAWPPTPNPPGK